MNTSGLTKKQERAQEVRDSLEYLAGLLQPGDTVLTVLKHVSRSGTNRKIATIFKDQNISGYVADAVDMKWTDDGAVSVSGCGMDMGFHLVYNLSSALFPQGFICIGENCPSNDHSNGDRDYTPHHHHDGGYALKQRWL